MAEEIAHTCEGRNNSIMEKLDSEFGDDDYTDVVDPIEDPAYDTELGYSYTSI